MPIPLLDKTGFLPLGIHDCSLHEAGAQFGSFQNSDRRPRLFEKLQAFVQESSKVRFVAEFIIDGSFVTAKADPADIDLIIGLSADHDFRAELRPFEYNVVSRRQVRKRYGLDVLVAVKGSVAYSEYIEFFQQIRGEPGRRKGILRVQL